MQTRGCGGDAFNHGLCVGSILQSLLREGLEEFVQVKTSRKNVSS